MSAQLRCRIRWRLSVLWALEWGVTGAILTYLPLYFAEKGLSPEQLGRLMAVTAVGLWIAPFIVGQVCDRWLATEKYLAVSHFVGGLTLMAIPLATRMHHETGNHFGALMLLVGLYAMAYFPTIPLASSLTFRHLPDPDTQFPSVRVWGTVGWVLSGLVLSLWLGRADARVWLAGQLPAWSPTIERVHAAVDWIGPPTSADCFHIAALLSFALSSFCVFLPATPPARAHRDRIAPLQVLSMFRDRSFRILIGVSFLLAAVVPFYTLEVPKLLERRGVSADWVPAVMTIGQISEFPALLLLPFCLKRFGLKATFALGMGAWLLRYALFACERPVSLVLTGIGLHGVCHVFLIIVIQLYVDRRCRSDLRASAQNLFAFVTMGIGLPIGFLAAGRLAEVFYDADTHQTNYQVLFSVAALFVLGVLSMYWKCFRLPEDVADAAHGGGNPSDARPPVLGEHLSLAGGE